MGFTYNKFFQLSSQNRLRKLYTFIIRFLNTEKKDNKLLNNILEMLQWINDIDGYNFIKPDNITPKELGLLSEVIYSHIEVKDSYLDCRLTDWDNNVNQRKFPVTLVLDNIRSPHNTGSILRNADAFGVEEVILSGITPTLDNSKVKRTMMNAKVNIKYFDNTENLIKTYKDDNYTIIGLEKTQHSINIAKLKKCNPNDKIILILGNEEFGLSQDILEMCNYIYHIDMYGVKNSLNVSVACGIALFSITNTMIYT